MVLSTEEGSENTSRLPHVIDIEAGNDTVLGHMPEAGAEHGLQPVLGRHTPRSSIACSMPSMRRLAAYGVSPRPSSLSAMSSGARSTATMGRT